MTTRKIIEIDEVKCNGCGACVTGCAEGALAIIDGKARLVKELFCDGFGDCIGTCPTGALTIVAREADAYDEEATRENLRKTAGEEAVRRMDMAARAHAAGRHPASPEGGCPGSLMRGTAGATEGNAAPPNVPAGEQVLRTELQQWPVQLHLVQPGAPFFHNRELVLLSTCSPVASPDVNWRFVRGRSVAVACPKLDRTEPYVEKLAGILSDETIPRAIVVRMEVPCCGGLSRMLKQAAERSGRVDLVLEEATIGVDGTLKHVTRV